MVSGSHRVKAKLNILHLEIFGIVLVNGAPMVLALQLS